MNQRRMTIVTKVLLLDNLLTSNIKQRGRYTGNDRQHRADATLVLQLQYYENSFTPILRVISVAKRLDQLLKMINVYNF